MVIPLWLISTRGVDFPAGDPWDCYGRFLLKVINHQATLADWAAQNNDHRILMPRVIFLALNYQHWSEIRGMLAAWIIVVLTSLGLLRLIFLTRPKNPSVLGIIALWFVCNLLLFCPQQYENWLSDMGIANVLPMFFTMGAMLVATSQMAMRPKFILASILCAASQFSSGNGIVAWAMVGPLLILAGPIGISRKRTALLWIAAAVVSTALYLFGYIIVFDSVPVGVKALHGEARFFFGFLGNVAAWDTVAYQPAVNSMEFAAILLALYLAAIACGVKACRNGNAVFQKKYLPLLMLAIYSIGSGALGALRRSEPNDGGLAVLFPRYVTFSIYLAVAVAGLVPLMIENLRIHRFLGGVLNSIAFLGLIAIVLAGFPAAFEQSETQAVNLRQSVAALYFRHSFPHNSLLDPPFFFQKYDRLDEIAVVDDLARAGRIQLPEFDPKHLERFSGNSFVAKGKIEGNIKQGTDRWTVWGYALNDSKQKPADAVFLAYSISGSPPIIFTQGVMGKARVALAEKLGNTNYRNCGWSAVVTPGMIPTDSGAIRISIWAADIESKTLTEIPGSTLLE
jgi:hypothetical protein